MTDSKLADMRKAAGARIDPATAIIWFEYAEALDPYGDERNMPAEYSCVGREWFAADPDENIRIHFEDLPDATCEALGEKRGVADRDGWAQIVESLREAEPDDRLPWE